MAIIDGSTATLTRPPLISNARSDAQSSCSSSGEMSTHAEAAFSRESSLDSSNRVMRAATLRTQSSPSTRSPSPKRLHVVPIARKRSSGRIGRRHRLDIRRPHGRSEHRWLQRCAWVLDVGRHVRGRSGGREQAQHRRADLQQQRTTVAHLRNGTESKLAPRMDFASAPRWPPRISWYTERKSTAYLRLPVASRSVRLGSPPYSPPLAGSPMSSSGAAAPWSVPPLAFSFGRRPNSDHVAMSTLSALPCA